MGAIAIVAFPHFSAPPPPRLVRSDPWSLGRILAVVCVPVALFCSWSRGGIRRPAPALLTDVAGGISRALFLETAPPHGLPIDGVVVKARWRFAAPRARQSLLLVSGVPSPGALWCFDLAVRAQAFWIPLSGLC